MPQNQDPLSQGPFSQFLTPQQVQPAYQSTAPQLTGYEQKGGIVAKLGDSFLQGLSRGRAMQQQKSQMDQANMLGAVNSSISQVENSNLPDDVKQKQLGQLYDMRGHIFLSALDGQDGGKKGKKDGNPAADFARHIVTSMLGPGKEKQAFTPEQIQASLFQTNQLLQQAPQLAAANAEKADAPLRAVVAKHTKDGKLDWGAMSVDPAFGQAWTNNSQLNGGKPSPYAAYVSGIGKEQVAEQRANATAEELATRQKREQAQADAAHAKTPEGLAESGEKLLGYKKGSPEMEAWIKSGGKELPQKHTATQQGYIDAQTILKGVKDGTVAEDDPRAAAARMVVGSFNTRQANIQAGTISKLEMVNLRKQALGIAGVRAVSGVTEAAIKQRQDIAKKIAKNEISATDAADAIAKINSQEADSYQKLSSAPPSAGSDKGDGKGGKKQPDKIKPAAPVSEDDAMKQWFQKEIMGSGGTAAPPASGAKPAHQMTDEELDKKYLNQ